MFSYDSLLNRRNLEDFLNSESKEQNEPPEEEIKNNFLTRVVNYFTKNSKIAYTYKTNDAGDDIEYSIPRSFSKEMRNIRDYLTNMFSKK